MIPREVIDEIVSRADIVDTINTYVTLKRAGSNYNGLCPFHSEKSPSFTVFPATRSFYCFGCGAGGDVISFVMRAENLDYPSAVELLAQRVGVKIPEDDRRTYGGMKKDDGVSRKRIFAMNLEAAKFFRACLFDPKIGAEGMRYLRERQLSGATIKHFGLGFSPNGFGALTDYMHSKGFSDEELITGFLCGKSQKTGKGYDYFRNRVMFPIIDTTGNVVAFGGRVMDDSKPKYLNTSDTPGFKKSRNLFALNYAKDAGKDEFILCEGYMDVIVLHAAGFTNAVATLGTAITPEQARIMAKYVKKVVISYDNDDAGQRAAARAMQILGEVGLDVRVLKMSGAKDPDEYIKKFGAARFGELVTQSRTGFEFKLEKILSKYDISTEDGKINASKDVKDVISDYSSSVEREVYIARASKAIGIPTDALKSDVYRMRSKKIRDFRKNESKQAINSAKNFGDRINPESVKNVRAAAAEDALIGLLLLYAEHRHAVSVGKVKLCADDFFTDFGRRAFDAIMELDGTEKGFDFSLLGNYFSPEEMGRLERDKMNRRDVAENGEKVFAEAAETLRNEKQKARESEAGDKFAEIKRKKESMEQKKNSNKNTLNT